MNIRRAVVTKYTLYPKQDPVGYAVGFQVDVTGGESFYVDTIVSLEDADGLSSNSIIDLAWAELRPDAAHRADQIVENESVIGRVVEERESDYPAWDSARSYNRGDIVSHNDKSWISDKDNNKDEPGDKNWTEQTDLSGDEPGEYQAWDSTMTYNAGDIVTHSGETWISDKSSNKSEPGDKDWTLYTG